MYISPPSKCGVNCLRRDGSRNVTGVGAHQTADCTVVPMEHGKP